MSKKPDRALTRRDFLRAAGAGVAGASLLGVAGCSGFADKVPRLPEEYLPGGAGPNVILVIIDSLRRDHVGAYGNPWIRTPTLDAIAGESLLFTHAQPEAMPTLPARRAIYTGMRTWPTSPPHFGWTSIPSGQRTLAETLEGEGYNTYLVTDTYVQFPENFGRGFGLNHRDPGPGKRSLQGPRLGRREEMQEALHRPRGRQEGPPVPGERPGPRGRSRVLRPQGILGRHAGAGEVPSERTSRSFWWPTATIPTSRGTHPRSTSPSTTTGYKGKEPLADNYGKDDYLTDRQLLRMRALYAAEVTMVDRWLGKFVERAHELGIMENTLLVVVSDHGHCLGEHGYTGKPPYALYPELTDTIFMIRHPRARARARGATSTPPPTTWRPRSSTSSGWINPRRWTARTLHRS